MQDSIIFDKNWQKNEQPKIFYTPISPSPQRNGEIEGGDWKAKEGGGGS